MFSVVFLLALLAFSVTGSPVEVRNSPITLPITRRLAFSNLTDLLRHDEARLAAFGKYSTHGRRDVDYYPRVVVAITWVGAGLPYLSKSGIDTNELVAVDYSYGSFKGTIFKDKLYFGVERFTIPGMQIGVASTSQGIAVDGVLGIGPTSSGLGALPNSPEETIPTVTDRLVEQRTISRPLIGIFFQPIVANTVNHGDLSFGATNPSVYDHDITTTAPSSRYWGINQRITYGNTEILANTAGIVDSGCTFLYLAIGVYLECSE
ncbi:hypothetical protein BDR04DRAFT_1111820 [Suillus decipiens]|nr:hypothetical protein BDR04DRAFT_1111820 [Suillus decipiens]